MRDANRSFSFIFESFAAFRKEPGLSIGAIISPHSEGAGCDPINPGLVLAACYIYFVYPRETAFRAIDVTEDDLRSFHLSEPVAPDEVLRGLRNCLSHGRFSIDDEGTFTFCDRESAHSARLSIRVHFGDLGMFADAFGRRMIERSRATPGTVVH